MLTIFRFGSGEQRSVWAGWKDAGLTNHGMNQAKALARWFSENGSKFDMIMSSTQQRADATAEAIHERQEPKPLLLKNPLLREQHFGKAEGHPYTKTIVRAKSMTLEACYAQNIFPHPGNRTDRFPEGESRDDVAKRAERAVEEIVLPLFADAGDTDVHVAIVSHGLFIRELVDVLLKLDPTKHGLGNDYRGLRNTGWTRITVKNTWMPSTRSVSITDVNRHDHLNSVERQKGGIGSTAYDPKQKDIRSFFGGGKTRDSG
ncbi:phosphoglycerate mutase family protein [Moniliophthora roreri]|nr:phosphoglycerate mutase family protein [Moniliophthora roreri]